jgi:hypothetical protein
VDEKAKIKIIIRRSDKNKNILGWFFRWGILFLAKSIIAVIKMVSRIRDIERLSVIK